MRVSASGQLVLFRGVDRYATGDRAQVTEVYREALAASPAAAFHAFDLETGKLVDLDPRVGPSNAADDSAPRRGRPRLGVIAREVTLLPRHWEWLATRPGGASATLRRLIEDARRADAVHGAGRRAAEAAYNFMAAMAGDRPGFEEASRALFAGDQARLVQMMDGWPSDIQAQISRFAFEKATE